MQQPALPSRLPGTGAPTEIFVHLAYGFGAAAWPARVATGEIVGLNEPLPYGYHHAERLGCRITYTHDHPETSLARLARLALRGIAAFDIVHAWRNRHALRRADVVWTHTESQSGAVGLLRRCGLIEPRTKLVLQSVWLIDRWPRMWPWQRAAFRYALRAADFLTFLSDDNRAVAEKLFPGTPCATVEFGISTAMTRQPVLRQGTEGLRVLSLGNDEHRDWRTLIAAVAGQPDLSLKIASRTAPQALLERVDNVERLTPRSNDDLLAAFDWADVVVVTMKPNLHASGITVMQEAAVLGKPIIATDTGGLRRYFGDGEVLYVPPGDVGSLRQAILACRSDPEAADRRAQAAQARMQSLNSQSYVRQLVQLSRDARPGIAEATAPGSPLAAVEPPQPGPPGSTQPWKQRHTG